MNGFVNIKYILNILGKILFVESACMLTSIFWVFFYDEPNLLPFVASAGIVAFLAIVFHLLAIGIKNKELSSRDAYLTIVLSWILTCVLGALPFLLTGSTTDIIDALFESVSGFSTTGSTIFIDVEVLPRSILWWRALSHWLGGMGILLLVVALIPYLKINGLQLYSSDLSVVGPEKLNPRINQTARRLWGIYIALTCSEILLLVFGGMPFFDSIVHSFSTISTGGFSVKNDSIAGYSLFCQYVIASYMLVSGVNFVLIYFLLKGSIKKVFVNQEFRLYLFVAVFSVAVVALALVFRYNAGIADALRLAFFQVSSIISTTGFTTANYVMWPNVCWVILLVLMIIGASSGSPGGGIKVIRVLLEIKVFRKVLMKLYQPKAIINFSINGKKLDDAVAMPIMAFILMYVITIVIACSILLVINIDFPTAIGATLSSLGSVGPGFGSVGPGQTYASLPDIAKIVLSCCMVLGRVELIPVYLLLSRGFWKN